MQNCFSYCFWTILGVQLPKPITKTILRSYAANILQICVNFQKYCYNVMSNDGLIIENMDLSQIQLAVFL